MGSMSQIWKQLILYLIAHAIITAVVLWFVASWTRSSLENRLIHDLQNFATLAKNLLQEKEFANDDSTRANPTLKNPSAATAIKLSLHSPAGLPWPDSHAVDAVEMRGGEELERAKNHPVGIAKRLDPQSGDEWVFVAASLPDAKEVGFVRLAAPLSLVRPEVFAVFWKLALAGVAFFLLSAGAVYAMALRFVSPLAHIAAGAQAIAAGDFDHEVVFAKNSDLNVVSDAFNRMQRELVHRVNQLKENNAQLATVLEGMVEGVVAVDANKRVLLANEASTDLLNCVQTNVVGRPFIEVCRYRAANDAIDEAVRGNDPLRVEFEAPGTVRKVLSLRVAKLPGDPCPGAVLVAHDVTELRRLENLRREFVANVSHELKTPLSSIKAYAETLRLYALNDPENNIVFVQRIEEQAERLYQLILDLLQIARVESGQEAFDIIDVPVASVVEASMTYFANAAAAKNIALESHPPVRPLQAKSDEEGLHTIVENLVNNAIKYTSEGGRVSVRWFAENENVIIEVEDTGIGIAPKDQARVFERFFRVDKARSRELGGTGLGLSIVKHLAQSFGGSVGLESKVGKGSVFRVKLPLA